MTAAATGFTLMGLSLLPAGYYAWKDDGLVAKIDLEISTFLRSVGEIAGSAGVTLTEAIRRIDARALINLQDYVDRLYSRLSASLPTPQCWDRFTAETGSELVKRSTAMLRDGAELGGRTDRVGQICSDYALQVSELRETRRLTSATFSYLSVPMHATVVFILVFVFQIVSVFSSKLSEVSSKVKEGSFSTDTVNTNATVPPGINLPAGGDMTGGLDMFATQDIGTLGGIIVFVIVVLTIANALAPKFAAGGSHLMITFYLSIMCLASGGLMFIIPLFTEALFDI
jgi:flagellar protein FlaJ